MPADGSVGPAQVPAISASVRHSTAARPLLNARLTCRHVAAGAGWPHRQQYAGVLQSPAPLGAQPSRGGAALRLTAALRTAVWQPSRQGQLNPLDPLCSILPLGLEAFCLAHQFLACLMVRKSQAVALVPGRGPPHGPRVQSFRESSWPQKLKRQLGLLTEPFGVSLTSSELAGCAQLAG